jgi:methyl-accepting chemotaxis protein
MDALRARRAGMRAGMGELERAVKAPAQDRFDEWAISVRSALESLREVVDHHIFATEAADGFLDEIVTTEPRLANQAQRLRDEHGQMVDSISAALARLRARPSFEVDDWVDAMRDRLCALLALLSRHRQRGADLVYEAYDVDLGSGG